MKNQVLNRITMTDALPKRLAIPSFWHKEDKELLYLHLGENPFPPTPHVQQAIADAAKNANRYPDTNCTALRRRLAEYVGHNITPDQIIAGNGSDELIDLLVVTFSNPAAPVAVFTPTFFVYGFAARRHGVSLCTIPRSPDYTLPSFETVDPNNINPSLSVSFIANPNNPTGTLTSRDVLIDYIRQWPGIVVVDECYYEFAGETVADLIPHQENLVVLRSLSKSFGLSGLRLGYAVAARPLVEQLECHAMTFPVNICAQAAGIAVLEDVDIYCKRIAEMIDLRNDLRKKLESLGLGVLPSQANFLLTLWPEDGGERNPAALLADQGVLVSDQTNNMNIGRPALRIAVGTQEECERLLKTIAEILR